MGYIAALLCGLLFGRLWQHAVRVQRIRVRAEDGWIEFWDYDSFRAWLETVDEPVQGNGPMVNVGDWDRLSDEALRIFEEGLLSDERCTCGTSAVCPIHQNDQYGTPHWFMQGNKSTPTPNSGTIGRAYSTDTVLDPRRIPGTQWSYTD